MSEWRKPLWEAIDEYVRACGGDPDGLAGVPMHDRALDDVEQRIDEAVERVKQRERAEHIEAEAVARASVRLRDAEIALLEAKHAPHVHSVSRAAREHKEARGAWRRATNDADAKQRERNGD